MTRRRWIADEFQEGIAAALAGMHAAICRARCARVRAGVRVACGDRVYRGVISRVSDERVEFDARRRNLAATTAVPITLLLAVFKFDRMEWAIEKCTELNVTTIVPVIARRTEKHLALAAEKRVERWRRIALEAAQQSRRVQPPEIGAPRKLSDALQATSGARIVLAETESQASLVEVLRSIGEIAGLTLAIGPEGGWASEELEFFDTAGWIAASLGQTILRAETAAIAALAIARAEIG